MFDQKNNAPANDIWPEFVRPEPLVLRLVLVDDHPLLRQGIRCLLALERDMQLVADTGNIDEGIGLVRRHRPDVVICDLTMRGCEGVFALQRLCASRGAARVLVLTASASLDCMRQSFGAGASGVVCKHSHQVHLMEAIRATAAGARAVCSTIGEHMTRDWMSRDWMPLDSTHQSEAAALTPADRQILRSIALGLPTRRIALDMRRGIKAVGKQREVLMRRLNLKGTAAATRYAVRCGLLTLEEIERVGDGRT